MDNVIFAIATGMILLGLMFAYGLRVGPPKGPYNVVVIDGTAIMSQATFDAITEMFKESVDVFERFQAQMEGLSIVINDNVDGAFGTED